MLLHNAASVLSGGRCAVIELLRCVTPPHILLSNSCYAVAPASGIGRQMLNYRDMMSFRRLICPRTGSALAAVLLLAPSASARRSGSAFPYSLTA